MLEIAGLHHDRRALVAAADRGDLQLARDGLQPDHRFALVQLDGLHVCHPLHRAHRAIHIIHDEPGAAVLHELRDGAVPIGDDRGPARHRFDHYQAERLGPRDRE